MAITYLVRTATVTLTVGHSYQPNTPTGSDTYTNTMAMASFDLSGYADADITIYGELPPDDGSITRTETVPTGTDPSELVV